MAEKKPTTRAQKGAPPSVLAGQAAPRREPRRAPVRDPKDLADPRKVAAEDAYGEIVSDELPGERAPRKLKARGYDGIIEAGGAIRWFSGRGAQERRERILSDQWAKLFFRDHYKKSEPPQLTAFERAAWSAGSAQKLTGQPEQAFGAAIPALTGIFLADESINSAKLLDDARQTLRRALERMDEAERKKTIAALMAYIGELQTSGALESVPSDRLARVAKLIGEAAEIVAVDPQNYVPLFRDREIDPSTGKKPTALQWFDLHWQPRVLAGEVTGDDIRQADFKFYESLASYQKSKGRKLSDLLPPSRTRAKIQETDEERRQRLNAAGTARSRRSRERKAAVRPS